MLESFSFPFKHFSVFAAKHFETALIYDGFLLNHYNEESQILVTYEALNLKLHTSWCKTNYQTLEVQGLKV